MPQLSKSARAAIGAGFSPSFVRHAVELGERDWARKEGAKLKAEGEHPEQQLERVREAAAARPVCPDSPMRAIRELARRRAGLMLDLIARLPEPVTREWLQAQAIALEARQLPPFVCGLPVPEQLAGLVKRVTCPHWWRRQLARAATLKREHREQAAGRVSARARALYVTNETASRHHVQQVRNAATLERTNIENHEGECITLAQAAAASTANKAIRRGELMTRIKGAEVWALARGMVGEFATLTLPSRFHATGFNGLRNPRWDGSTPKQGQQWLCRQWARVRAELARQGLRIFGFRIAEPHHDGCPHWHAIWWADSEAAGVIRATVAAYWLQEDGDEPGALEHRAKFEQIDEAKGGACAYLAKYIAKNIDDAGAVGREGHRDEWAGQRELEGMDAGRAAQRVAAWASAHGIRQFQAIGQPPVGVWREIRRLPSDATGEDSQAMRAAMLAVNRQDERRACWAGYLSAQGGAMLPRKDYRLKLAQRTEQRAGVYGLTLAARPYGVSVAGLPGVVYQSQRKQWKPKGTWTAEAREAVHGEWGAMARAFNRMQATGAGFQWTEGGGFELARGASVWSTHHGWASASASPKGAQPWTRVNNCTGPAQKQSLTDAQAGFREHFNKAPGGDSTTWKPPKWTTSPLTDSKTQPNPLETLRKLSDSCRAACAQVWS